MHQPSKWWVGLLAILALWLIAIIVKTDSIEADIADRARSVLAATWSDLGGATNVGVSGRDVLIEGLELADGDGRRMGQAVADAEGVRLVDLRLQRVPQAKPFEFSATRVGDELRLAGSVPSPAARARLFAAAKTVAAGSEVVDGLAYAAGAPPGFETMAVHGVSEAARLGGGAFSLVDTRYSISGTAGSSQIFEAAVAATRQLPAGAMLAKAAILPPEVRPYVWSAASDGNVVTVSGSAPSIDDRATIAREVAAALPAKSVADRMQIARGAPAGDFVGHVRYAVAELGRLANGNVTLTDGGYSIVGEAGSSEAYEAAIAGAKRLPSGLKLVRAEILPPISRPYRWEAHSDGKSVTLSGTVPSAEVRTEIAAAVGRLFPGGTLVDRLAIARGAPTGDFTKAATGALTELARLTDGAASMTDGELSIRGHGPAGVSSATVGAAARAALPPPFTVGTIDITESVIAPYVFKLEKRDSRIVLSGYAPDDKARDDLAAAAKAAFFNDTVENALKTGAGAPANFVDALKALFPTLARLSSGGLSLDGTEMTVDGQAVYGKAADRIKAALAAAVPAGFKLDKIDVGVSPPGPALDGAACQPAFDGLLVKGRILFDTGSARLSDESAAVLDHLVDVVQRCRDLHIEVAGHTDSVGAAASNLELSQRRAQAVVSYIEDAGIDVSRISSAGYGQTKPVASNDTPEGRAQNRRIEFLVK